MGCSFQPLVVSMLHSAPHQLFNYKYFINELNQLGIHNPAEMVDFLSIYQALQTELLFYQGNENRLSLD